MTSAMAIERIDVPKSCDLLAEQLRRQILGGEFEAGAPLPPERDLVALSGLSRGSVREALRILEADGLIRTRPGRYGGSVVSQPADDFLARHVEVFAKGRSVSLASLIVAREALEPMMAKLAALHRTDEDLASLRVIAERLEAAAANDITTFLAENVKWHYALALASHNDLLRAFMASLMGMIEEASRIEALATPELRALVVHAHRRIFEAIEARDADTAHRRMERHVAAYSRQANEVLGAGERRIGPGTATERT